MTHEEELSQEVPNKNTENNEEQYLSKEQETVMESVDVPESTKVQIDNQNQDNIKDDVIKMNEHFELNKWIYKDVLFPQLEENEKLKRDQKKELMEKIFQILKWQFIFTYVFVFILIISTSLSSVLMLKDSTIEHIIEFIQFYITAIIAELIAILFFIVKNVFDTSIIDLVKNFDKTDSKEKIKTKDTKKQDL